MATTQEKLNFLLKELEENPEDYPDHVPELIESFADQFEVKGYLSQKQLAVLDAYYKYNDCEIESPDFGNWDW